MPRLKKFLIDKLAAILGLAILFTLYSLTTLPSLSYSEEEQIRKEFNFSSSVLYEPTNLEAAVERAVHPQYDRISAWISSVGAAVSVMDSDGDGIHNDICHVDPRYDKVFIAPAKGTGNRFNPVSLEPGHLKYESKTMAPMGTVPADYNEDGRMDVMVYYWGRTPIVFLNTKEGFQPTELIPQPGKWFSNAATTADFDGDGHLDILIGNYFPDFEKVLDADATDRDQVMQHSMSRAYNGAINRLFLFQEVDEDGYVIFKEIEDWLGNEKNQLDWTLALAAADINGDLLPEIYVANDFGPDRLLHNHSTPGNISFKGLKGTKGIRTLRSNVLGKDSFKGMGADFVDVNGDGLLDIYVSNIAANYALHESHFCWINTGEFDKMKDGIAPYKNESESLGISRSSWGWDSKFADFNNDGIPEAIQATGFVKGKINRWPELQELAIGNDELLSTPEVWPRFKQGDDLCGYVHNPFFVLSDGRYFDAAELLGIDQQQVTRGLATGDLDRDGDLELIVANQWEPSRQYNNELKSENNFLGLNILIPTQKGAVTSAQVDAGVLVPTRHAVGAAIKVKSSFDREQFDYVDGGNGHSGVDSKEVFFGLGKSNDPVSVQIDYRDPDGKVRSETLKLNPGWHDVVLAWN